MRLHSLRMQGFRRHIDTTVYFSDATFLIGENNIGKSSVFHALDYLLHNKTTLPDQEYFQVIQFENETDKKVNKKLVDKVILTAEFRNVPKEAYQWSGFKGRILRYECEHGLEETGLSIVYRKTFDSAGCKIEMKELGKTLKAQFEECKTVSDFVIAGLDREKIHAILNLEDENRNLTVVQKKKLLESESLIDELYNLDEDQEQAFFKNPGGIASNVLSKLPRFLLIPAQDEVNELNSDKGQLQKTLSELFRDIRERSENFRMAQQYLNMLKEEMNPQDAGSEFGQMMIDLNHILKDVFPNTGIYAEANLSDADKVIKPLFDISIESNVITDVKLQGTGVIRSAVFAILRYRKQREAQLRAVGEYVEPLLIAFEEPEIYLHPNAAAQMRETIYDLASSSSDQIVCTTHSPYMIDLSKKSSQILNHLSIKQEEYESCGELHIIERVDCSPFNITSKFKELEAGDRDYIKMLLRIDSEISKVFFAKKILIIEGDTEEVVLRETISRMDSTDRSNIHKDWQIIKARGKATIIPLVRYLKAMGLNPFVLHDRDNGTDRAVIFNISILEALNDETCRIMLEECIEDILGYQVPSSEKPYKAYKHIQDNWSEEWESIPVRWREVMSTIFGVQVEPEKIY